MENFEGNYSRGTKIKLPLEIEAQRLMIGGSPNCGKSLSPTRFETENVGLNSPILRYLCGGGSRSPLSPGNIVPRGSRSPLSAVENLINRSPPPSAYRTPVKAVDDEEVLVMDGLPFQRRSRFSDSESSGSSGKSLFKADIFQSSENSGDSRQSPKVQLSRAKEDQRATRLTIKNITESQVNNSSNYYDIPGLFNLSPDTLFLPQTLSLTFSELGTPARTASPAEPRTPVRSALPTDPMPPKFHGGNYFPRASPNSLYFPPPPAPEKGVPGSAPRRRYIRPPLQSPHQVSSTTVLDTPTPSKLPDIPTSPDEMIPPKPHTSFLMDIPGTPEEISVLTASRENKTAKTSVPTPATQTSFLMDNPEEFPMLNASLKNKTAKTLGPTPEITSAPTLAITSATSAPTPEITSAPTLATQTTVMIAPKALPERWSPQDDGINMEDSGDEYIDSVLTSGFRTGTRRFSEFCPDP